MRTHPSNTELWKGVLTLLSLTVLVTIGYGYMLSLDFTATDSLRLIKNSRLRTWRDLKRIFGEGIMGGEFYRPVAQLSYSLDYALSRLSPVGYQLTDLLLHLAVTLQLALLARRMKVPGGWAGAWLSGALFTLHPILIESVPAVARRHDLLATALGLFSLLLLDGARYRLRSTRGILSLVVALLALGSKEIAVILPALVVSDVLLNRPFHPRNRHRLVTSLGWIAITGLFLIWRQTRGAMGADLSAVAANPDEVWAVTQRYFVDLLAPVAPAGRVRLTVTSVTFTIAGLIALVAIGLRSVLQRSRFSIFWGLGVFYGWGLIALTRRPDPRNLYLPTACLCMLWGGGLAEIGQAFIGHPSSRAAVCGLPMLIVALGWASASPLWVSYPGWRTASALTHETLQAAEDAAQLLPAGSTLHILNLPKAVIAPSPGLHERSASVMRDHTVQSWLDMQRPDHPIQVNVCSLRPVPADTPRPPLLIHYYGDTAAIVVASKPDEKDAPWSFFWWDGCRIEQPNPEEAVTSEVPASATLDEAHLGETIQLKGHQLAREELEVGQTLSIMLYWSAKAPPARSYTVFVHLVDAHGDVLAQHDSLPVSGTYPTERWPTGAIIADGHSIVIEPNTPPGRYTLIAGMYDTQTMARLPVHSPLYVEDGPPETDAIILEEVTIKPQE